MNPKHTADVRLIAAAPDLLEACLAMVTSFHGVEWMETHMQESIAMGRAAIAKANGGISNQEITAHADTRKSLICKDTQCADHAATAEESKPDQESKR